MNYHNFNYDHYWELSFPFVMNHCEAPFIAIAHDGETCGVGCNGEAADEPWSITIAIRTTIALW